MAAQSEEVALDTGTGSLAGSLLIPDGQGPFPAVLIIAGSGPTDRDGNSTLISGHNNILGQLAEGLARAGVASLRIDHSLDDAYLWCRLLQSDPRFSSLTVVGDGQGAQGGADAAWLAGADGYVSVAGPVHPVSDVLRELSADKDDLRVSIGRFDGPVAIVQSTTDIQVSVVDITRQAERHHREKKEALDRALRFNGALILNQPSSDSLFPADSSHLGLGCRVGHWARLFLKDGRPEYRFGLAEGGYVAQGRLVLDDRMDCVNFLYRCTELARAGSPAEAVAWALRTRFAGAPPLAVVDERGAVDYDRPEHLDYSLDMIRTGIWGRDITSKLTGATADTSGSSRYPAGSFQYVPGQLLRTAELKEGDIVWLVLDPAHEQGAALRRDYGLVIGHIGIVIKDEAETWLVHAASSDLEGCYQGGRLVRVPIQTYLERVEKFAGVVVTRL